MDIFDEFCTPATCVIVCPCSKHRLDHLKQGPATALQLLHVDCESLLLSAGVRHH